ncbi:GntR family transcriptional regulator [Schumannella luteola]
MPTQYAEAMSEVTAAGGLAQTRPLRRRAGLREEVHEAVLELLVTGAIAEGSALRVDAIAQQLGVSPTPVREALVQLESTGLVEHVANKGFAVAARLRHDELAELVDARSVLEVAAARRAAAAADPELAARLDELTAQQERAAAGLDAADGLAWREYLRIDHAFHDAIFDGSRNRYLVRLAHTIDAQAQRVRQSVRLGVTDADAAIAEHRAIAAAIAAGDVAAADAAMAAHLHRVLELSLDSD